MESAKKAWNEFIRTSQVNTTEMRLATASMGMNVEQRPVRTISSLDGLPHGVRPDLRAHDIVSLVVSIFHREVSVHEQE